MLQGRKPGGKRRNVIVKRTMVAEDGPGDLSRHARREKPLKVVIDEEYSQMLRPSLTPQGIEPGKGQDKEDEHAEPEPHFDKFLKISFKSQEDEGGQTGYDDSDEALYVEGKGTGDIKKGVAKRFCPVVLRQVSRNEATHGADHKEGKGAVDNNPMSDPKIFPRCGKDECRDKGYSWSEKEICEEKECKEPCEGK